jgi:DNA-binding GntR family transcriptional regulator
MLNLAPPAQDGDAVRSQARRTFHALRDRIIRGDLAPRTRLKIADLAVDFGVSPGAVREALSRLTTDRLVEAWDQRGFRVAPISLEDLDDLTETRIQIEGLALRQAIERGDGVWEAEVRAAHAALAAHEPAMDAPRGARPHDRFHHALAAGCRSANLLRVRDALYDLAERYRCLAARQAAGARPVADEHAAIAAAALARNEDAAVGALADHIRLTARIVRQALEAP